MWYQTMSCVDDDDFKSHKATTSTLRGSPLFIFSSSSSFYPTFSSIFIFLIRFVSFVADAYTKLNQRTIIKMNNSTEKKKKKNEKSTSGKMLGRYT